MLLFYAKLWLFWFLSQSKSEGMQLRWKWYNNFHYRQEVSNFSAQCHWMSHPSDRFKGFLETFLKYEVPRFLLKIRRKPIGSALIWRRRNKSTLAPVYPFWACMGHECHLGNLSSAITSLGILTVKFGFLLCATDKIVYIRQMSKIFQQRVLLRPTGCILSQKLHESFHKCWTKHSPAQTLHLASITKEQSPLKIVDFQFWRIHQLKLHCNSIADDSLAICSKIRSWRWYNWFFQYESQRHGSPWNIASFYKTIVKKW